MELLKGTDLRFLVDHKGALSVERAAHLAFKPRQRMGQQRLSHARQVLNQQMPSRQKARE